MSRLPNALQALHYLLVRIRHQVGMGTDAARTTRLLDHAEYLVTLLIRGKESEFRQYLDSARAEFPEFAGVLQAYDESLVAA